MNGLVRLRHQLGTLTLSADFTFEPGITALFGPSGAGKTSILRAVAGLLRPDAGHVEMAGKVWFDGGAINLPPHERKLGYVFQEPRLFPHLSVARNLRFGARDRDGSDLVSLLGLGPLLNRRPSHLSGGEAQRVALARALLSEPQILLMDEPLAALDLGLKQEIMPYLEALRARTDIPILYVSHDIDEVTRLADRVILIEHGECQAAQPVADALATAAPTSGLGRAIAGGLLRARIEAHHGDDGLTELSIGADRLWLAGRLEPLGGTVQLRIEARDVTLSVARPQGLSALNILPVTIRSIDAGPGAGALVRLDHDGQGFAARLTTRSVRELALASGQQVHAILKTMSVAQTRVTMRRS